MYNSMNTYIYLFSKYLLPYIKKMLHANILLYNINAVLNSKIKTKVKFYD